MSEIINGADQAAVVGMLAKFAADRATSDSVADAKEGEKSTDHFDTPLGIKYYMYLFIYLYNINNS